MRKRILILALVTTGIWAVARFKPTSENSQTGDANAAGSGRKILLVDGAEAGAPVVSALEAGRTTQLSAVPLVGPKAANRRAAASATAPESDAEPMHDHTAMAMAEMAPTMHLSTTSAALAPVSGPGTLPVVQASGIARVFGSDEPEHRQTYGSGGPAIIIRGGMGGPRDDCDLHRRGGGVGIAINRSIPSFGGGGEIGRARYPAGARFH